MELFLLFIFLSLWTSGTYSATCEDCAIWAVQGLCYRDPDFMQETCSDCKSCPGKCIDEAPWCAEDDYDYGDKEICQLKPKVIHCSNEKSCPKLEEICRASCSTCTPDATATACEKCEAWAARGYCDAFPMSLKLMDRLCKDCRVCNRNERCAFCGKELRYYKYNCGLILHSTYLEKECSDCKFCDAGGQVDKCIDCAVLAYRGVCYFDLKAIEEHCKDCTVCTGACEDYDSQCPSEAKLSKVRDIPRLTGLCRKSFSECS